MPVGKKGISPSLCWRIELAQVRRMVVRGLTTVLTARTRGGAGVGVVGGGSGFGRGAGPAVAILGDGDASCRGSAGILSSWWRRKKRRRVIGMMLGVLCRLRSSSAPRMLAFFLICLAAVCLLLHGRHQRDQGRAPTHLPSGRGDRTRPPSVTVFAAPRPMASSTSLVGRRQELAVRSWLALSPYVSVVLFGRHPSIFAFAAALGPRVSVESAIDFTFLGTPFFHTMVARSQASHSDVSVLIDPETILFPDFITTLSNTVQLDHDWLLVSIPRSVSNFSFHLNDMGKWWPPKVGETSLEKLQEVLGQKLHGDHCSGRVLLAWNKGNAPLHGGVLPPFVYGKGFHNQWLINEALSSELRVIIDASEAFLNVYPEELGHEDWLLHGPGSEYGDERTWETDGNSNLAAVYGSIYFKRIKFSNLVKLVLCSGHCFFMNAAEGMVYFLDSLHQQRSETLNSLLDEDLNRSLLFRSFLQSMVEKRWRTCLDYSILQYREDKCSVNELLKVNFTLPPPLFLPFSLESLLQMTADEHKTVVLSVAGHSYRDMLMSWVCRLRHLSITNFIVGALDSDIYQFSVLQGLPVFKDPLAPNNISTNDCHFGSECFQRVTKVKSRLVLQILKLGFNVLLSDVDVYWFHNPLPYLHSFGPATFLAQSDEYNETGPINLPRRLNSGFYFAHSDAPTISAMEKVVKHASTSNLSEQPSFYDVLCGEGGINRVSHNQCIEPETNLTVTFLDRNLFPNGAFRGLWEKHDVEAACLKKGCLILHNNWISGRMKKLERQVLSGLWAYNTSSRMCLQHWKMANS